MNDINYYLPVLAFFLCLIITPAVRMLAARIGWMAYPVKERWHKKPTALMGGIALFAGMALPRFITADFTTLLPHIYRTESPIPPPDMAAVIWIGITFLFMLGLLDDFLHIKPQSKLIGQIIVASLITFLGFRLQWFTSLTLDTLVTIVWIVGMTNAFNLIDNMDGLCAGVGTMAAFHFAVLFYGIRPDLTLVSLILGASMLAFLFYNFNPASIFMGDSGSLLIGFSLSMLGLHYAEIRTNSPLTAFAVPIMVLLVPIMDTTMVTLIRWLSGRKASVGGKDHTSHRLVLMGFSERGAVMFLYGTGMIAGIGALFVSKNDTLTSPAVIIPMGLAVVLMGLYLAQLRVYPEKEFSVLRNRAYTPVLIELTYKRQLMLIILDFGLIAFAYYLSYRLRFDGAKFSYYFKIFLESLPALIAVKFLAFYGVGIYRGFWRFMSTSDVFLFLKASLFATLLSVAAVTFIYRFVDFSKGIFIIDWLITTALLLGTRGSFRLCVDAMNRKTLTGENVLIYGAGRGGEILLREILNNHERKIRPIGFIDDDPVKTGKKIQGYPILGSSKEIPVLCDRHGISGLLISFNHHHENPDRLQPVKDFCKANHLFLRQFSIELKNVDLEYPRY